MTSRLPYDVAIVGAGLAGSVVAASLARTAPESYRAILIDAVDDGVGTAYRATSERLLMNGPVRAMSIVPGDKAHLQRAMPNEHPDALISRGRFGDYARATLREALSVHNGIRFERHDITDIEANAWGYALRDAIGETIVARCIVLALGNFAPNDAFVPPAIRAHPHYAGNPWTFDANAVRDAQRVMLVGSGLTAMDVVALLDESGFAGNIHLVSRHGHLPEVEHPQVRGLSLDAVQLDARTPSTLVRTLRRAAAAHTREGGDWRAVAESIREISPAIWQSWSLRERRQFLRHLQPYWSVHRYRVPEATYASFERLRVLGRIERHRGRILDASALADGSLAVGVGRPGARIDVVTDVVVNCTGPQGNYAALAQPLVENARRRGLLRPDTLHLGIDADANYNVKDASGIPQPNLFTLGPPLRGLLYETTAVPETRDQAARIAGALVARYEPTLAEVAS